MTLLDAEVGKTYVIKEINTNDDDMNSFLFRLGCYSGEPITVVSKKKKSCVVVIKDGRYSLDQLLSEAVIIVNYFLNIYTRRNFYENCFCRQPEQRQNHDL